MTTKELVLELAFQANGSKAFVEISESHTFQDVRRIIQEDLDEDMVPLDLEYFFCIDGIRLSTKQEARKLAWNVLSKRVSIHNKYDKKRAAETAPSHMQPVVKRIRLSPQKSEKGSGDSASSSMLQACDDEKALSKAAGSNINEECEKPSNKPTSSTANDLDDDDQILIHTSDEEDSPLKDIQVNSSHNQLQSKNDHTLETKNNSAAPILRMGDEDERKADEVQSATSRTQSQQMVDRSKNNAVVQNQKACLVSSDVESDDDDDTKMPPTGDKWNHSGKDIRKHASTPLFNEQQLKKDDAVEKSKQVLRDVRDLLKNNPLFCSEQRHREWNQEIHEIMSSKPPQTVVGVLGGTGVGKSSCLNALLDEAAVLPTSGSRGCTATVVELRFRQVLLSPPTEKREVAVYHGTVEFIRLEEWISELKTLLDECSTHGGSQNASTIYARAPDDQRQPDVAAAWSKLDQVYGAGTMMRQLGKRKDAVFDQLSRDPRVRKLLTPGPGESHNSILVEEGMISVDEAIDILEPFQNMGPRLRRQKKKWASNFRSKINDYVYRKGNGNQPQTWPLIRKVVLEGPWSVLATGACLVDLPGVRDANVARAKVSEQYLQECHQILVVAPIKRAVDDGTARELLGEQFKRRLLMDGQYSNVAFICTQTDDCEATEIMRDHKDVAKLKPGRWEKMTGLRDNIAKIEKQIFELTDVEEELKAAYDDALQTHKEAEEELLEAQKEAAEGDDPVEEELQQLSRNVQRCLKRKDRAQEQLNLWRNRNSADLDRMKEELRALQRELKCICALVRNEYSTGQLQADFRAGLEDLVCASEDAGKANGATPTIDAIPKDFQMSVHCVSSNDYLKILQIKPSSDGPANTFTRPEDTQIPLLRQFIHKVTAQSRKNYAENFVNTSSDMLDRVKLLAGDVDGAVTCGRAARRYRTIFDKEMENVDVQVKQVAEEFLRKTRTKIQMALTPSLHKGAAVGQGAALATVESWGSTSRRSRQHRDENHNGLYFSTYQATVRRDGVYISPTAGEINFNEELCAPMEKEFMKDWASSMDSAIRAYLNESEAKVLDMCALLDKSIMTGLVGAGLDADRLRQLATTASRNCQTTVKNSFRALRENATNMQRNLNRSLLPMIQERMRSTYYATNSAPGGPGKFDRMKKAMRSGSSVIIQSLFNETTAKLLAAIEEMMQKLSLMINSIANTICLSLTTVYSVCWEDQADKAAPVNPEMQKKVRECRDKVLPDLNHLRTRQDESMSMLGIAREELELDVLAVDTWEQQQEKKLKAAIESGDLVDLTGDSDDDDDISNNFASVRSFFPPLKVKREPRCSI